MSVHQIVYCSKNRIPGSAGEVAIEIDAILRTARSRNERAGVSGALLFSGAAFAQVLEGPLAAIQEIFESILCDERHQDVVLLRNAAAPTRVFTDWSMAYADPGAVQDVWQANIDLDAAFARATAGAPRIINLLEQLVLRSPA